MFIAGTTWAGFAKFSNDQDAGAALPSLTLAELMDTSHNRLPQYIRLTGSNEHPDLACNCIIQTRHNTLFLYEMPRTEASWHMGQLVPLVEIDDSTNGVFADQPGDVEGYLTRTTLLPGWGSTGNVFKWSAPTPVFILWRMPLDGKIPKTGTSSALLVLLMTWPIAIFFFVFSMSNRFRKAQPK